MNTQIKQFQSDKYQLIKSWWDFAKEVAPELKMLPRTSYIMYHNEQPILSVSLFLTNGCLAWVDNYIGNPEFKGEIRKQCGKLLLNHLEEIAKLNGKDRLFCMSTNDKTSQRYTELGFNKTCSNVSTYIKELV